MPIRFRDCLESRKSPLARAWIILKRQNYLTRNGLAESVSRRKVTIVRVEVAALPVVLLNNVGGKSPGVSARNVGVAACPEPGPAKIVLAVWARSCGVSVPLDVIGEPETVGL